MGHRIVVKRRRTHSAGDKRFLLKQVDLWAGYWRQNIHRFITEYLGLTYYANFQPILLFYMDRQPYFIYASSRGLAKKQHC